MAYQPTHPPKHVRQNASHHQTLHENDKNINRQSYLVTRKFLADTNFRYNAYRFHLTAYKIIRIEKLHLNTYR